MRRRSEGQFAGARLGPEKHGRVATQGTKLAALALVLACTAVAIQPPDAAYRASFEKWKAELVADLKQNWLLLAGLFWLKPGSNTFGSAGDNAIVLPSGPEHAGTFQLQGDAVSVELRSNAQAKIDGKPVTRAVMAQDVSGNATVLELGSLRLHVIQRGQRVGVRVKDLNSAAARNYTGPMFFPLDMNYRVVGTFVPADKKRTVEIPNVLGDVTESPVVGVVHFTLAGQELSLTALSGDPATGLGFVIGDVTGKTDTYPGGRFLETEPVVDGKVVLDFNRAYSPPCAVTPYATCPLAPKENRLPIAVLAGEKYGRKHGHAHH